MHHEGFSRDPRSLFDRFRISCIPARTWSRWRGLYQKWTSLRTRTSPITWRKQNIFDTNRIGGSLSISLETLDHWEFVLTSTKRCPQKTVYTENLEDGTNHGVLPPVGGNGVIPGGVQNNSKKVDNWGCMQSDMIERWNPLFAVFG